MYDNRDRGNGAHWSDMPEQLPELDDIRHIGRALLDTLPLALVIAERRRLSTGTDRTELDLFLRNRGLVKPPFGSPLRSSVESPSLGDTSDSGIPSRSWTVASLSRSM